MTPAHDSAAAPRGPATAKASPGTDVPSSWVVIVPVKVLARAKSRLAEMAGPHRERLALAMATDTVTAALACDRVRDLVVVTDDSIAAPLLARVGARVVPDEPGAGLNPALQHGAGIASRTTGNVGLAALSADLPALRPHELSRALDGATRHDVAFVADAAGVGTTLYAATSYAHFAPGFGAGSRDRHAASGAHELTLDGIDSLRRDVDTPQDLREALRLGPGRHVADRVQRMT